MKWMGRGKGGDRTSPSTKAEVSQIEIKPLSDRAYESLYFSLLDLQANTDAAEQLSVQLGVRRDDKDFVGWLRRFGKQRLKNAAEHRGLAERMMVFGVLDGGQVSAISRELGEQLLEKAEEMPTESEVEENVVGKDTSVADKNSSSEEDEKRAEFYFQQGNKAAFLRGDFVGAIAAYNQALTIKPDDHDVLYNKGLSLARLGRDEAAITAYEQVLKIKPDDHDVLYNKGLSLTRLGRDEAAITAYEQALKIKPDNHNALNNKGGSLANLGQDEAAIIAFNQALNIKSNKHNTLFNKGLSLANLGRDEDAITVYDQALDIKSDDHEALNNKGLSLIHLGRYEAAITAFEKALDIKPDMHETISNKGISLVRLGRYEAAITAFDQALKIKPDNHQTWLNRGIAVGNTIETEFTIHSPIALQYPTLMERGYEGEQASYLVGLEHVKKSKNPEGWGLLHHQVGRAHYFHGRFLPNAASYLNKAAESYNKALSTLTADEFPLHCLEILSDAIRTHLGLRNADIVKACQEKGLTVFHQLISDAPTPTQKKQLEQKFSSFSQIQVDTLIRESSVTTALETAEHYKNKNLGWILDRWQTPNSPSLQAMEKLLTPKTATIYWHLSPDTLTTFLLAEETDKPQIISFTSAEPLKTWGKDWHQVYQTYRKKGKSAEADNADRDRLSHPWRLSFEAKLKKLRDILEIDKIEAKLSHHTHLLLVPHRQLHQLPLHALFTNPLITAYLPSLQIGLNLKQKKANQPPTISLPSLLPETPENETLESLIFAEVETTLITHLCQQQANPPTILSSDQANNSSLTANLNQPHRLFHFTGHAAHDYRHPKNSALALTGTDTLTANEIAKLSLDTYDLVTLAACETAVAGQVNLDTDYVGLASAFLTAGANQVISTLWTVDSESNAWLMVKFYQQYLTGTPAPIALHRAQQWLKTVTHEELADWLESLNTDSFRQSCQNGEDETLTDTIGKHRIAAQNSTASQAPYANPYYWAAFTLTGYCHEGQ